MKKSVNLWLRLLVCCIFFLFLSCFSSQRVLARSYQPVISGSIESGDRLYTDPGDDGEEPVDYYSYDRMWLRYRQQLAVGEYYYLKFQHQQRIYEHSDSYDNLTRELEGNYTFYLSEKLRNRIVLLLRDKDYLQADYDYKSYQTYRIQYTLQYDLSDQHDWEVVMQRQQNKYDPILNRDYFLDRLGLNWTWDISDNLRIQSRFQVDRQLNEKGSDSTDKYGRRLTFNFRYRI
ncbi:hypothetical protein [Halanaerobium hydrogeniformans]|uniref:DUF2490 domain-containing protein n=1 Tax=Halanaerobium hydrogeniformans TaxID=656519 RepID=E4RPN7_HALHG|nr:hypothetical protein [Halanaerobium hydrogeniformans]ADQ13921.1 hypothetical protein Halsa_0448 [Halanaerobium hydrogeniformans]